MSKLPVLKPQEMVTRLERLGCVEVRQRGAHKQFRHPDGRANFRIVVFVLLVMALPFGAWAIRIRLYRPLAYVEVQSVDGTCIRVNEPDSLRRISGWLDSIGGPGLRQWLSRRLGTWCENGLRPPDYQIAVGFEDGSREELAVWVYGEASIHVRRACYSCRARTEPFTALMKSRQEPGRLSEPVDQRFVAITVETPE